MLAIFILYVSRLRSQAIVAARTGSTLHIPATLTNFLSVNLKDLIIHRGIDDKA